ncbi:E3 ubiquitin-protein ligase At4g11680-like [Zingiber officinale]|uniref:RING-type E3 ubiquitin transferase n=1 Tax=Zingiber officinale TaxID=94328 RepID=A0A8J5L015_ZINOF|nr:E3 ubiquitin-protein ligase At4g11680-like [Zingiber officinale]KAG6505778.1 hypothetical protein ZIOFF_038143 [Zingiber officinale]
MFWLSSFDRVLVGGADAIDPFPLVAAGGDQGRSGGGGLRRPRFNGAAWLLRRAGNRRAMREPSLLVRESAAEQLEERQSGWAYSRPVVLLDILWNVVFVASAAGVLALSRDEAPSMPLRLWIGGYALQCVFHIVFVCVQFRRRRLLRDVEERGGWSWWNLSLTPSREVVETRGFNVHQSQNEGAKSVAKYLESTNTFFSFIWWILGFYWVSAGGQALTRDAPQLYWLCIVFLAFDVFFVLFCVALACVIGLAVCCCLPCIIAILYAVADQQEGASDEDIYQLPKYRFQRAGNSENISAGLARTVCGMMIECGTDSPVGHVISPEDAECCICLLPYNDGDELRELPCRHHFHRHCVDKWLHINATCPLCKYNIIKSNNQAMEEEV